MKRTCCSQLSHPGVLVTHCVTLAGAICCIASHCISRFLSLFLGGEELGRHHARCAASGGNIPQSCSARPWLHFLLLRSTCRTAAERWGGPAHVFPGCHEKKENNNHKKKKTVSTQPWQTVASFYHAVVAMPMRNQDALQPLEAVLYGVWVAESSVPWVGRSVGCQAHTPLSQLQSTDGLWCHPKCIHTYTHIHTYNLLSAAEVPSPHSSKI